MNFKEFPRGINSDQVISLTLADGCNGSVHPGPGLKRQAPSDKRQATSSKPQAPWSYIIIIDMRDIMGYINLMIGLLIGQCAQAWNLQSSPPLKSRGVGGNSGLQAKPFFPKIQATKIQASSDKRQAPSNKHQASSRKQPAAQ